MPPGLAEDKRWPLLRGGKVRRGDHRSHGKTLLPTGTIDKHRYVLSPRSNRGGDRMQAQRSAALASREGFSASETAPCHATSDIRLDDPLQSRPACLGGGE